jgi:ribosomal protein S18 acetylase RimI-like enzyme
MRIIHSLSEDQENDAVELLFEAFGGKFASMIGLDDKAKEAMRRSLDHQSCFVAYEQEQLMGILGYQIGKKAFIDPKLKEYQEIFGFKKGIKRYFNMGALYHRTKADELYISDISVSAQARGKGIGTELLKVVEQHALDNGLRILTLAVIGPNTRAKALYERIGFVVTKKQDIRPFNRWMHWDFDTVYLMRKELK